jgi:hypothetical protein
MARASLRSKNGERVFSTGTHTARRKFDVTPQPERVLRHVCDGPIKCCQPDCSVCGTNSITAMFDTMMRANRAAGL